MASTLGEKLKHLRIRHGDMTAVALARVAGVSKQTMSLWLKGERRPSIDEGLRMARYFKVPLDWLADDTADYPPPEFGRPMGGAVLDPRPRPRRPDGGNN